MFILYRVNSLVLVLKKGNVRTGNRAFYFHTPSLYIIPFRIGKDSRNTDMILLNRRDTYQNILLFILKMSTTKILFCGKFVSNTIQTVIQRSLTINIVLEYRYL